MTAIIKQLHEDREMLPIFNLKLLIWYLIKFNSEWKSIIINSFRLCWNPIILSHV